MLRVVIEVDYGLARAPPIVDLLCAMVPIVLSDGCARRREGEQRNDLRSAARASPSWRCISDTPGRDGSFVLVSHPAVRQTGVSLFVHCAGHRPREATPPSLPLHADGGQEKRAEMATSKTSPYCGPIEKSAAHFARDGGNPRR